MAVQAYVMADTEFTVVEKGCGECAVAWAKEYLGIELVSTESGIGMPTDGSGSWSNSEYTLYPVFDGDSESYCRPGEDVCFCGAVLDLRVESDDDGQGDDVWADSDALAGAGYGTDEDYGYYGE